MLGEDYCGYNVDSKKQLLIGETAMATITYRTGYGKKAKYTVRIEELIVELKELKELTIQVLSVQIQNEAPVLVS